MYKKNKKLLVFGVITLSVILAVGIISIKYFMSNTLNNLNFEVIAQNSDEKEIFTDSSFIIKSEKNYSSRLMKKIVSVQPGLDYTLSKTAKGTYLITPTEKLADASIYNICINVGEDKPKLSWAFQTKAEFKVTDTLPGDLLTYVSTNTGIEISFSKNVGSINDYFEITPKVEGKLEVSDKKVIFVPNEFLASDTVYKVKVKKGLKSYLGDELQDDYTFSFRTEKDEPYINLLDGYQETQKPDKSPTISLYLDDYYDEAEFLVNVYKLSSLTEYVNYLEAHYKNVEKSIGETYDHCFDMSNHEKVLSYTTYLLDKDLWYKSIELPDKLPVGWYIVDITNSLNDIKLQKALQISNISVYTYGLNSDIQVWLNDSETGDVVSGATVQLGDLAAISNKDGIASFNVLDDNMQKLIVTSKDKKEFAEYINITEIYEPSLKDNYYMYVYTDRNCYLPTDKINYWGVIIPRKTGIKNPLEVEVEFYEDIKQVAKVDENGAFSGSIDIVSHEDTWCNIMLNILGKSCYVGDIEISDYVKPVYKLSSAFDKSYYRKGDNINLLVYGKFYDGTSAENVKVKVDSNNGKDYKIITLDANGEAKAKLRPININGKDGASYFYTTLEIDGIDEYASAYNNVLYFPTDYYINYDWNYTGKKLTLSTNKVNYDAIDGADVDYDKLYSGESFDQNVKVEVIESTTEKRYTGETEYDYYSGTFVPKYTYDRVESVIDEYNLMISKDEDFVLDLPIVDEKEDATYQVKIIYTYPDGFYGVKDIYVWAGNDDYESNYYYFFAENNSLKENETTRISLKVKNMINGRMLYLVSTDKINKIGLTKNNFLDLKMTKDLIPNCIVSGAFFDGSKVHEIDAEYIFFNAKDKELNIEITTDKEVYRPGDKAKVKAKVTNTKGDAVKCNFLFSIVDEAALFDTYEQDILYEVYEERYHIPVTFTSDIERYFGGGDGGGGDEIRDTFLDVLAFEKLHTDENGEVDIEFELSDDLTSWRITGIAISSDVEVGSTKKNITTSIPFFINQVMNKKYVENDDITISLRTASSSEISIDSLIKYDLELLNSEDEVIEIKQQEAKPLEAIIINFGKLSSGKYKVKVVAQSGEYKDTILKEFEVVNSLHEVSLSKEFDISDLTELDAVRYPVRLMLFDKNNALYYKALNKILTNSNGGTNEQVLAKNFAYKKLNEFYDEALYDTKFNVALQNYTGGINKLLNDDADTFFTAQVVANASEYINVLSAKRYFYSKIKDEEVTSSELTAAYMGLAALKEPVLTDIKYLLENNNNFEVLDKINLINALSYIGDYAVAKEYYEKEIQSIMTTKDDSKFISPEYEGLYYQATSRILPTLALTNHKDFNQVLKYVLENDTKEYIPVMDLMAFINNYNPTIDSKAKLVYSIEDKKTKVDFSDEKLKILALTKSEFEGFKVESLKGEVRAIAEYIGNVGDIKTEDDEVKISKKISSGEMGEYSTVTLNITLPKNKEYILDDVIPSSSRYVALGNITNGANLYRQEGQKLKFYINSKNINNITITYKIRNIFSGEFVVESPYVTNKAGKVFGLDSSNLLTFTVK